MRASLQTGGVPVELKYRPQPPAPPGALRALRRLDVGHQRVGVLPVACCTRCTTRSARCARSCSSSGSPRSPTSSSASARSRRCRDAISKDAGVADVSGYTDYGRVWREFLELVEDDLHPRATVIVLGDARTNGRDPRADVFARIAARAGPHVLAQPRAAAVLELRRLGDRRLRAVLRGLRVLDDAPARGLREGAHASSPDHALTRKACSGCEKPFSRLRPGDGELVTRRRARAVLDLRR